MVWLVRSCCECAVKKQNGTKAAKKNVNFFSIGNVIKQDTDFRVYKLPKLNTLQQIGYKMRCFFSWLFVFCSALGCASAKPSGKIKQGIDGYIQEVKGNRMPSPDIKPAPPKGISTTVYIYELTNINQTERIGTSPFYKALHTKLVQTVTSDSTGHFSVSLPVGQYSLFTKVEGKYYANNFDAQNNIAPVQVNKKKLTKVNFLISAAAVF